MNQLFGTQRKKWRGTSNANLFKGYPYPLIRPIKHLGRVQTQTELINQSMLVIDPEK